ncbi:MAG TPA: glucosaminidase domain-containing protein [Allosphingosinicella sp.]|jgi:flagellar protein FlgJ
MASINGSVGAGGINRSSDVQAVQERLNRHVARVGLPRLRVDGAIGPKTIEAIRRFQTMIMGLKMPDGRVDAQGKTIAALEGHPSEPAKQTKPVPAHVSAFIAKLLPAARKVKESWGVRVAVTIAQAALETGWGQSVKSNAYFGIKGKSPSGKSTTFTTHEVIGGKAIKLDDKFRAYESLDEAADDYGRFLNENPRYAKCFSHKDDPEQFVTELAAAGYATDPDYAAKIISMIRRYGLADHDKQTK